MSTAARRSSPFRLHQGFFITSSPPLISAAIVGDGGTVGVAERVRLKGVVFDMDETLTVPVIDFPAMYRAVLGSDRYVEVGCGSKHPPSHRDLDAAEAAAGVRDHRRFRVAGVLLAPDHARSVIIYLDLNVGGEDGAVEQHHLLRPRKLHYYDCNIYAYYIGIRT